MIEEGQSHLAMIFESQANANANAAVEVLRPAEVLLDTMTKVAFILGYAAYNLYQGGHERTKSK